MILGIKINQGWESSLNNNNIKWTKKSSLLPYYCWSTKLKCSLVMCKSVPKSSFNFSFSPKVPNMAPELLFSQSIVRVLCFVYAHFEYTFQQCCRYVVVLQCCYRFTSQPFEIFILCVFDVLFYLYCMHKCILL